MMSHTYAGREQRKKKKTEEKGTWTRAEAAGRGAGKGAGRGAGRQQAEATKEAGRHGAGRERSIQVGVVAGGRQGPNKLSDTHRRCPPSPSPAASQDRSALRIIWDVSVVQ